MLGAFFLFFILIFVINKNIFLDKKHISEKFDLYATNISNTTTTKKSFDNQKKRIFGIIVPHHLVASSIIEETFGQTRDHFKKINQEITQIIVLSPNHFLSGDESVIASDWDWQTNFGIVESDKDFLEKLKTFNFADIDSEKLEKEHGVVNIVPFVKYYFPKAKIVPLMIRDSFDNQNAEKLAAFLSDDLSDDSLIVVSADFSHYLPQEAADFHDQSSISALYNLDAEFLEKMDIDTSESLAVLFEYLKLKKAQKFVLVENANSSDFISGGSDEGGTTSYVSGYFIIGEKESKKQVSMLAFGDMMLDREVFSLTKKSDSYDYPFEKLDLFMRGIDFRLANLEGPITDFRSVAIEQNILMFTFSPLFLEPFKERFEIFNLANNHTFNFGRKGLDETRDYLAKTKIDFFGDPNNSSAHLSRVIEKNDIKIGLIGYNDLIENDISDIQEEIKKSRAQSDFLIVYAHWGNEYQPYPSSRQKQKARIFIDAGADLIIGSHPHVIQPMEVYKGKAIFYSLGNFVFDQYFSEATKEGLSAGILLEKQYNEINSEYYLFPIYIDDKSQPKLADPERRNKILENFKKNSIMENAGNIDISSGRVEIYK